MLKKEERSQISILTIHLKKIEKENTKQAEERIQ